MALVAATAVPAAAAPAAQVLGRIDPPGQLVPPSRVEGIVRMQVCFRLKLRVNEGRREARNAVAVKGFDIHCDGGLEARRNKSREHTGPNRPAEAALGIDLISTRKHQLIADRARPP